MGDSGFLSGEKEGVFIVHDTKKMVDVLHVHIGTLSENSMSINEVVELRVDSDRRSGLRRHHSSTQLLHAALRNQLGNHVAQKGSLVGPDRLRFDISHPKPVSSEEISEVMNQVNLEIQNLLNLPKKHLCLPSKLLYFTQVVKTMLITTTITTDE